MQSPPEQCKRHKWMVRSALPMEKKTPTGHKSSRFGIWESRMCVRCFCTDGRWDKGIDEPSVEAAFNKMAGIA
ncbi:hypothetical protein [Cupriavidus sp. Marseille-Q8015]